MIGDKFWFRDLSQTLYHQLLPAFLTVVRIATVGSQTGKVLTVVNSYLQLREAGLGLGFILLSEQQPITTLTS